jgi:hypothetical protein
MCCAAPRNNTLCIRAEVRGIPVADDLDPLECLYFGVQGTGAHSAIHGDGEAGRVSGFPLLPVFLGLVAVSDRTAPRQAFLSTIHLIRMIQDWHSLLECG